MRDVTDFKLIQDQKSQKNYFKHPALSMMLYFCHLLLCMFLQFASDLYKLLMVDVPYGMYSGP